MCFNIFIRLLCNTYCHLFELLLGNNADLISTNSSDLRTRVLTELILVTKRVKIDCVFVVLNSVYFYCKY
jgi:hypothetical protein